jgi:hypothetical protein
VDTSQREARLFSAPAVPPAVRLDTTVCFEAPVPPDLPEGPGELCAELRDRFDDRRQSLPCIPFRFDADDAALRGLEGAIAAALEEPDPVPRLDALATQARKRAFPGLALRLELIAVYTLRRRGTPASLAEAAGRLRGEPSWIGEPAAARWAGQLAYERATLQLDAQSDLEETWRVLRDAERGFRLSGDRKWIAAGTKQAEILSRAGALGEARARLRFCLDQCAAAPCDPGLARAAENTLGWLINVDPDAGEPELAEAERTFTRLLEAPAEPLERANLCLNLAIARQRRGLSSRAQLEAARGLLVPSATGRGRELAGWAELIETRQDLAEERFARAAERGERLGNAPVPPRLRALGLSGAGAAFRRLGALPRALACFTAARALHARAAAGDPLQVPLGPGQRAEDTYAAARVLLELSRPGEAWALLADLDGDGVAMEEEPADVTPWLATLRELERPASGPRRAQREALRTGALDRMQEIVRQGGNPPVGIERDEAVTFRAFPLDDEVLLLRRTPGGEVVLARRTPMPRSRLVAALAALEDAMARQEPDDARWSMLAAPVAGAVSPDAAGLPPLTIFAMHGLLQRVPLAALPLPSGWLGTATTVAWHPAGGPADATAVPRSGGHALFVVDPLGDLGLPDPGEEIPAGARLLAGGSATREALRAALPPSRWLHVDAHAWFEPAFPDLSTVLLADGPLLGQELAAWAAGLELANLSGCQTGRAPVTADSGRFGILGLLARRGVPWVVGARAALPNALAVDFNRAFYGALEGGAPVPVAYRRALADVSRRHPASHWAALLLLHGPAGGQTPAARTPSSSEGVR